VPFCPDIADSVKDCVLNECLQNFEPWVGVFDALPVAGCDVIVVVQVKEIGAQLSDNIFAKNSSFFKVGQKIFMDNLAACKNGNTIVALFDGLVLSGCPNPAGHVVVFVLVNDSG
jgi:hypothetical protein